MHLSTNRFIQSFSWMLLHSLWQGLLLAVLAAAVLLLTGKAKATQRYNLLLLLFGGFVTACIVTFIREWSSSAPVLTTHTAQLPFRMNVYKEMMQSAIHYFSANAPVVVLLWGVLFIYRVVKTMGAWLYIQQARTRYVYTAPVHWQEKLQELCIQLHLRKAVTLLESGYMKMPLVIGHLKPVILIPAGLLTGLPAAQIEAVLLHELAHIRRNDFFVNSLQVLVEIIFFFNPGLLWISSLLREEREHCCDDVALAKTGNKRAFIEALIAFKENALAQHPGYAVTFPGKKNLLLQRVNRIIGVSNKALLPAERLFFAAGVLLLSVILAMAMMSQTAAVKKQPAMIAAPAFVRDTLPVARHSNKPKFLAASGTKKSAHLTRDRAITRKREQITQQTDQQAIRDKEQAVTDREQTQRDCAQADRDRAQAIRDSEQAEREKAQAARDRDQARKDREQADKGRAQADLDRLQAKRDKAQAERDRHRTEKDRFQAEKERLQTLAAQQHDNR